MVIFKSNGLQITFKNCRCLAPGSVNRLLTRALKCKPLPDYSFLSNSETYIPEDYRVHKKKSSGRCSQSQRCVQATQPTITHHTLNDKNVPINQACSVNWIHFREQFSPLNWNALGPFASSLVRREADTPARPPVRGQLLRAAQTTGIKRVLVLSGRP